MSRSPARQTFGQKNVKASSPAPTKPKASKGGDGVNVHPAILAGGMAFVIAVSVVFMIGGQPQAVPGQAVRITEVSNGSQPARPAAQAPAPQQAAPASGGKFGAANDAIGKANR
jgi:hypothetical protein